jgi:hypothetical protein
MNRNIHETGRKWIEEETRGEETKEKPRGMQDNSYLQKI